MTFQNMLKMLEYSTLSYNDISGRKPGEKIVFIDDKAGGAQCFLRYNKSIMTIVFRGSDSEKDWITNFTFSKKKIPYGNKASDVRVHKGFLEAYKSPLVRNKLHELMCLDCDTIYITGHSYGAALAVLCALDLQYNFPEKEFYVTLFGCPRVGNEQFSKSYNSRVFNTVRIENGNDIVTKVPPKLFGYRHVGAKIHVGKKEIPFFYSFKDHRQISYYSAMYERFL